MYTPIPCQCPLDLNNKIEITEAEKKHNEGNKNAFVVYTIKTAESKEAKRRYSEFESFRRSLVKLYPTLLIPPIPEKHSLVNYTTQNIKDDSAIIEKRKRMLERFLLRLAKHPILVKEHVFHRFLDGTTAWTEIRQSSPLSDLPRDPLLLASESSSFATSITSNLPTSTSIIPIPSTSYTLKYPDKEFEESEQKVGKSAQQSTFQFEKSQKRILRRLGDLSNDYAELGSAYNALSLNETGLLATFIEKMGQVIDGTSHATKTMVQSLEMEFAEYVQDYSQYLHIAKQVLRYRRMKEAQLELIEEAIDHKKLQLRNLTKTEDEASKLDLKQDDTVQSPIKTPHTTVDAATDPQDDNIDTKSIEDGFSAIVKIDDVEPDSNAAAVNYPTNASASVLRASKHQTKKWSSPRKLFSAVTDTIQGMMDADPGQTRRNQISKLKETIDQLKQARVTSRQELKDMTVTIQQDFDRLQVQKEAEIKYMLIAFAKIHVVYCEQNAASWKDIRNQVKMSMEKL
ncbi:PX-domain-containing protein [Mucor ambiguus]|uniref:PX-domain-containing protein n=1 Tax=Mucor ambiguus TaxID=91626 RepID=A0A0C9MCC6_9FUNG|nr:PX-domain-containing protein [Mucor ambiguus]